MPVVAPGVLAAGRFVAWGAARRAGAYGKRNKRGLVAMWAKARDPVRRAKIAASKFGKPRPRHVIEAMPQANLGSKASASTRAKMRAAAKRRRAWPPAAGKPFSHRELWLIQALPPAEAAKRTGRTLGAVYSQRHLLGVAGYPTTDLSVPERKRSAGRR